MGNVYTLGEDGITTQMSRIHCTNEDKEIQLVLENNLDLIPGDQIEPEDPRRWLLIKREMPVPDPNTGNDRWYVDFFIADQDAVPTFVECKRFNDTRARREIIGQAFEYAANAHYYWTKEIIQLYAEESAKKQGQSLDEAVLSLAPTNEESPETFFERVKENLREAQIRIVFFLEDSPMELRSVVDFLNSQMERSEILLVEARLYEMNGSKIVVPTLFGYTDEARKVKRFIDTSTGNRRRKWDEESYFEDASNHDKLPLEALRKLYDYCKSTECTIKWGTGAISGSFSLVCPSICSRSIISIFSNGDIQLNFGWLHGSESAEVCKDKFKELLMQYPPFVLPENVKSKYPIYSKDIWAGNVDNFIQILKDLLANFEG